MWCGNFLETFDLLRNTLINHGLIWVTWMEFNCEYVHIVDVEIE